MTIKTFEKRLQALEKIVRLESEIFFIHLEMSDSKVREAAHMHGGEIKKIDLDLPSPVIAATYVEELLNESGPGVAAWVYISDIREFFMLAYEDPEFAALFDLLLPGEKIQVLTTIRGANDSDRKVNIRFCLLYSAMFRYFNGIEFHNRYKAGQLSEHDDHFFNAMLLIYQLIFPEKDSEKLLADFTRWVIHAGELNKIYPISDN